MTNSDRKVKLVDEYTSARIEDGALQGEIAFDLGNNIEASAEFYAPIIGESYEDYDGVWVSEIHDIDYVRFDIDHAYEVDAENGTEKDIELTLTKGETKQLKALIESLLENAEEV